MSVFSLVGQVLGHSRKRSAEIRAPKSYERKHCKSCALRFTHSRGCQYKSIVSHWDTACAHYVKRKG